MKRAMIGLMFAVAAIAPAADTATVAGKWTLHTSIAGYENDLDCTFTQTGSEMGGTCKGEQGTVDIKGKVDEKKIAFQHKGEYNGEELTIVYNGSFESGSKFGGTVTVEPMAVDGEFTATQAK